MTNEALNIQVAYALSRNESSQHKLIAVLQDRADQIMVSRELLSSLYARLGNDSMLLNKVCPEAKHVDLY